MAAVPDWGGVIAMEIQTPVPASYSFGGLEAPERVPDALHNVSRRGIIVYCPVRRLDCSWTEIVDWWLASCRENGHRIGC